VGKPEGKRPLGRLRYKWIILQLDLTERGWNGMNSIYLAQNKNWWWGTLVNTIMMFQVP
jgi:hypothetical protein